MIEREKWVLRAEYRSLRSRLTPEDYRERSRNICVNASRHRFLQRAKVIHAYWPSIARREVDLRPLIVYLRALGKEIVLPVVCTDAATPSMHAVLFHSEADLTPNRWGILEPGSGSAVDPDIIDAVITPALAADLHGTRLGYGGGFYDVFLRSIDVPALCPIFDPCVADTLTPAPHDIPVDVLITETRTVRCSVPGMPPVR